MPLFIRCLTALTCVLMLLGWTGVAEAAPPEVLQTFTPASTLDGNWERLPKGTTPPSPGESCVGDAHRWRRSDGVGLAVLWSACNAADARAYGKAIVLTKAQYGHEWSTRSALNGADVVQPVSGNIVRSWVQDDYVVALASTCGPLTVDPCADITARVAVYLSARMPGTPVHSTGLPPINRVLGSLVVTWCLVVGAATLSHFALRPRYALNSTDHRIRAVDKQARRLRRLYRGRRWGQALLISGALVLLAQILAAARSGSPSSWPLAIVCGLALPATGVVLLVKCRSLMFVGRPAGSRGIAPLTARRLLALVITAMVGMCALAVPVVSLVGMFLVGLASSDADTSSLFSYGLVLALAFGWLLDRGAQRLRARNAAEAIRLDPRDRFIYLRYFGDDTMKLSATGLSRRGLYQIATGWASIFRSSRFEEVFTRAVGVFGPVIAVDPPDQRLKGLTSAIGEPALDKLRQATRVSQLGAPKLPLPMGNWQAAVEAMASQSYAVIVGATPGAIRPGLRWEVQLVAERVGHGRIVLIIGRRKTRNETIASFGSFVAEAAKYPLFTSLQDMPVADGTLLLVHVPNEGWGTWHGWGASRRTAWTYTAAIDEGLRFARAAWSRPAVVVQPFDGLPVLESVTEALATAGRRCLPGTAVGTADLLRALADVDALGRWDRILLHEVTADGLVDPAADYHIECNGTMINRTCEQAIAVAVRIGRRGGFLPLPPGVLVLGLIAVPNSAAASLLGIDSPERYRAMWSLVSSELLGSTMNDS
jgi:hypothetical protein